MYLFQKFGKCFGIIINSGHLGKSFAGLKEKVQCFPKYDRIKVDWRIEIDKRGLYKPIIMLVPCNKRTNLRPWLLYLLLLLRALTCKFGDGVYSKLVFGNLFFNDIQ